MASAIGSRQKRGSKTSPRQGARCSREKGPAARNCLPNQSMAVVARASAAEVTPPQLAGSSTRTKLHRARWPLIDPLDALAARGGGGLGAHGPCAASSGTRRGESGLFLGAARNELNLGPVGFCHGKRGG